MEYIPINPKTIINISPQKYGYKFLENVDTLKDLTKTTLFINNSSEIDSLARMITSVVEEGCETTSTFEVLTTTDNKAFIDRFYQLIQDNLNLGQVPEGIDIKDIGNLKLKVIPHPNTPALNAVYFVADYFGLEQMLKAQMRTVGIKFANDRHLSKEELETPLVIDEETFLLYGFPVKDDKTFYLSPISLRYIVYIYASIIHQFIYGK